MRRAWYRSRMKNPKRALAIGAALLLLGAVSAFAEKAGDSIYDLGLGFGMPVSGLNLRRFGGGSESAGGAGFALSPRYLYQASPEFGVGLEILYMNFPSAGVGVPGGSGTSSGDLFGGEAVARYLLSPDAGWSPYLTGGVGIARYAVTVQQGGTTILDAASTGLTLFPGVGVKADLGSKAEVSGEARWQLGTISRSSFGTSIYNILGFFVRLGWRT